MNSKTSPYLSIIRGYSKTSDENFSKPTILEKYKYEFYKKSDQNALLASVDPKNLFVPEKWF